MATRRENRNPAQKKMKKKQNPQRRQPNQGTLVIPRRCLIMPDKLVTTLRWWQAPPVNLLSQTWAGLRYNANGAFDPDPTAGSTTPSGFNQLAAMYNSYRGLRSRIKVDVINPDPAVPVTVVVAPVNLDPGVAPSSNYIISLVQNAYAKHKMLAPVGAPAIRITNSMTTQRIFGNRMVLYDDNFTALVTSNPVNVWYWVVGFYSPAVHSVSGVVANVEFEMDVEFYDRKVLNNATPSVNGGVSVGLETVPKQK